MMKKLIIFILLFLLILGITGCENDLSNTEEINKTKTGEVILHLSKNNDISKTSLINKITQSSDTNLPRSAEEVQSLLKGYRIKIKGNDVNRIKDGYFEDNSTETTVSFSIPEGKDYIVQVVALGPNKLILGAGETTGVIVEADTENIIQVPMEPYKFDFSNNPDTVIADSTFDVNVTISGPILSKVLDYSMFHLYYSRDKDSITGDYSYFGERVFDVSYNWLDNENTQLKLQAEIPALSSGPLYFQFTAGGLSTWDYNDTSLRFTVPCMDIGEKDKLPLIQVEENTTNTDMTIEPIW